MTTTPVRSDATLRHLLPEELDQRAGVDALVWATPGVGTVHHRLRVVS